MPRPQFARKRPVFTKPGPVALWPDSPFEKWSRQWVRKNFWKVEHIFLTPEDALQECAVLFSFCLHRYTIPGNNKNSSYGVVKNEKWLMQLFMTIVRNAWIKIAKEQTYERVLFGDDNRPIEYDSEPANESQYEHNYGPMAVAFAELSDDTRRVFTSLLSAPAEVYWLLFERPLHENVPPAIEINQRIRRFFGIRYPVDIVSELSNLMAIRGEIRTLRRK